MRKVLILAYDFPPYISVGALRPYSWFKYFPDFNVKPIVVTRQWSTKYGNYLDYIAPGESYKTIIEENEEHVVIKTPYKPNYANRILLKYGDNKFKLIRKLITGYYEMAQFIFNVGTKSGLYYGANEYLKNNKVDVIIATGSPHILFKYASKLSKKYKTPWIADYRDPWSQSQSRNKNGWLKYWNRYFEKKFLKNVSLITVATEFVKGKVSTLLKDKQFIEVLNGYDPITAKKSSEVKPTESYLSIALAGTIYKWHPIESILKSIAVVKSSNPDIKLRLKLFGTNKEAYIKDFISKESPEILDLIEFHSKLHNEELLPELAKEHLMLLFNDHSLVGTKIYDYLAVKRNILFCYTEETVKELYKLPYYKDEIASISNQIQQDIIAKTNSGYLIKNSNDLREHIINLYDEFLKNGKIECNSVNIEFYSRKKQAEIFCNQLIFNE
jgi:hypothetical protein